MQDYHRLRAWLKSQQLALAIYRETARFPRSELYGLTGQLRRAAVSIPSTIAEDCGRGSAADLARFLRLAAASANELESQLLLGLHTGLLAGSIYRELRGQVVEVRKMLCGLLRRVLRQPGGPSGGERAKPSYYEPRTHELTTDN